MKLSAYYKSLGNDVKLKLDYENLNAYDKVTVSKVFMDTPVPECVLNLPNVEYGGTGFYYDKAPPLLKEVEHMMPDYHLYDEWVEDCIQRGAKHKALEYYTDYSIGFTTRGCIRGCSFCVNQNCKTCSLHSPISEFVDTNKKYICLLDDNVFACKNWNEPFQELKKARKRFQFKQGLDERLLTDEKCEALFSAKWIGDYIFAFDNIKDKNIIEKKLELIRGHTNKTVKFYTFCAFNHDTPHQYSDEFWKQDILDLFERIKILMRHQCLPYIMRYKDYVLSPYVGTYINLASWCNQPNFFKKKSFIEWCISDNERKGDGSATIKYFNKLVSEMPEVEKYLHMKFEDFSSLYKSTDWW